MSKLFNHPLEKKYCFWTEIFAFYCGTTGCASHWCMSRFLSEPQPIATNWCKRPPRPDHDAQAVSITAHSPGRRACVDQTDSQRHHVIRGALICGLPIPIPPPSKRVLPFKHRLHVFNLFTWEFLELRVRVKHAVESRSRVALADVKSAGQFGWQLGGRVATSFGCRRLGPDRTQFRLWLRLILLRGVQTRLQFYGKLVRCHNEDATKLAGLVWEAIVVPLSSFPW